VRGSGGKRRFKWVISPVAHQTKGVSRDKRGGRNHLDMGGGRKFRTTDERRGIAMKGVLLKFLSRDGARKAKWKLINAKYARIVRGKPGDLGSLDHNLAITRTGKKQKKGVVGACPIFFAQDSRGYYRGFKDDESGCLRFER